MTFKLPELPYDYTALEPYMDAKTVEVHYSKHHQGYTNKLNAAFKTHPHYYKNSIEEILEQINQIPEEIRLAVRNNGGGFYHHNLWWSQFTPERNISPSNELTSAINDSFDNFDGFKENLSSAGLGVFGSGWAWLVKDNLGSLSVITTPNQDSPISLGLIPLLTIDVWEHAYYLQYQNRRNEFIENFWNIVNWPEVDRRFREK